MKSTNALNASDLQHSVHLNKWATYQNQGSLYIDRVFTNTGVDCAGPIDIRMSKGRGAKSYKAYITLFICLSTKVIHIEVVSEMSTAAFLAAYRRFVSRRGTPANMYSDNGTNFVGASKIIQKTTMLKLSSEIINELSINGTLWHFIPPKCAPFWRIVGSRDKINETPLETNNWK